MGWSTNLTGDRRILSINSTKCFFQSQQQTLPRQCWSIGCISIGLDAGSTERKCHRVSARWIEVRLCFGVKIFTNGMLFEGKILGLMFCMWFMIYEIMIIACIYIWLVVAYVGSLSVPCFPSLETEFSLPLMSKPKRMSPSPGGVETHAWTRKKIFVPFWTVLCGTFLRALFFVHRCKSHSDYHWITLNPSCFRQRDLLEVGICSAHLDPQVVDLTTLTEQELHVLDWNYIPRWFKDDGIVQWKKGQHKWTPCWKSWGLSIGIQQMYLIGHGLHKHCQDWCLKVSSPCDAVIQQPFFQPTFVMPWIYLPKFHL